MRRTDPSIPDAIPEASRRAPSRSEDAHVAKREAHGIAEHGTVQNGWLLDVLMNAPVAIAIMSGPEHHFKLVNELMAHIAGRSPGQLLGRSLRDALPEFNNQPFPALLDEVYRTGRPYTGNEVLATLNRQDTQQASEGYFNLVYQPTRDAGGEIDGVIIVATEVTEQVLARKRVEAGEALLREKEDFLRLLLDSAAEAFYAVDGEGVTTSCNAAFVRMLGFRNAEEAIGKKLHDIIHHSHPDGSRYPKEECPIYQAARTGKPAHVDDEVFFRLDGSGFPVEYRAYPIVRSGEVRGAITTFTDISERKAADAALRSSQERLKIAQQAAGMGTWDWNIKTGELIWSETIPQIHGLRPEDFDGTLEGWIRTIHHEDVAQVQTKVQEAIANQSDYYAEFRVLGQDGLLHWVSGQGKVLVGADHTPERMVGIGMDIDARKQQEKALRDSEKLAATGRMAATLAHEINNPLEAVTNILYLLRSDPGLAEQSKKYLEMADFELRRVAHISQHTLAFYRSTTKEVDVDLAEVCKQLTSIVAPRIASKKIVLKTSFRSAAKALAIDTEVRQVISNLILNAVDAAPLGSVIQLVVDDPAPEFVRFAVEDYGRGVSEQDQNRLFEAFFTTKEFGTGLGLWVSQDILKRNGGTLKLESPRNPTRFAAYFKKSQSAAGADPEPRST